LEEQVSPRWEYPREMEAEKKTKIAKRTALCEC
jgi:hypothetical protein